MKRAAKIECAQADQYRSFHMGPTLLLHMLFTGQE